MKRQRKKYQSPKHPWQATRINEEAALMKSYGLKNKKELWRATSKLRNWRAQARKIVGLPENERAKAEKPLFSKLVRLGLLNKDADIDNILGLTTEQVLDGRLQTQIYKKGLASTVKQARQFIVHGKVLVNSGVVTAPSFEVSINDKIALAPGFKPVKRVSKKKTQASEVEDKAQIESIGVDTVSEEEIESNVAPIETE